jgi:phenylalanyl-tRNA synthetase alpha chain
MDIINISQAAETEIKNCVSLPGLEELKVKYLGRKGVLAGLTGSIPQLPVDQRGIFGKQVNELKNRLAGLFAERQNQLGQTARQENPRDIDITLPGICQELGHKHPLTLVVLEICEMFEKMGFTVVDGPEIESEYNNFTGLNIPLDHPSREAFDTFYLNAPAGPEGKYLLRSQTSTVQISAMKAFKPPLAIVAPGRVYRPDAVDASHSFMFHQIEGFMVGEDITFSDLKGVLEFFAKGIFGEDIKMRFRPHFFPFTEPSAEVDISCIICKGKGCSVCGRKGWLEILGSGMIHPNVFKNVGYDPKKYTGFAFGMGVERIAMLKYGINDIRLFFENDLRFLKQF